MRYQEIFEAQVIDFNPQVTRQLFDLDLAGSRGALPEKLHKAFRQFLFANKNTTIRLYHGTSMKHDVANQGLLPTSSRRRLSLQSGSGYVYLTYDPMRALSFATMGYPSDKIFVIYAVEVPICDLKPDPDKLKNKRMWSDGHSAIGSSLADSFIYGGGARVRGTIWPYQISVYGYFDRSYHRIEPPVSPAPPPPSRP